MGEVRRRNKPTFVCTNCKKRKTKCDRKVPCASCVRTNSGFSCTYESNWRPVQFSEHHHHADIPKEEHHHIASTALDIHATATDHDSRDEVALLRQRLSDLEAALKLVQSPHKSSLNSSNNSQISNSLDTLREIVDEDDIINFYDGYSPPEPSSNIKENYGPLSYASIIKRDPWLCLLWQYLDHDKYPSGPFQHTPPNDYYMEVLELDGYRASVPLSAIPANVQAPTTCITVSSVMLARTLFEGKCDPDLSLRHKILSVLPKKKVIWCLLDKFFAVIYPFYPFLDETSYKQDMTRILGPICYEDAYLEHINISEPLDLANIAMCLILLRLGYLSLFSNRRQENDLVLQAEDTLEKYLLTNPINFSAIEVARFCLQAVQPAHTVTFTHFQVLLYHRIYASHAPEEGEVVDGGESQVSCASLVRLAYSLGLHREPDKFEDCRNDERMNHLGRKIWYFLTRMEMIHCFNVGGLPCIDQLHCDVREPRSTENNSNIVNLKMETYVTETMNIFRPRMRLLRDILSLVLDINNGCSVTRLVGKINELEEVAATFLDVLALSPNNDIIPASLLPEQYSELIKAKVFLLVKSSLTTLYFHLYLHYERKSNFELSYYYLSRLYRTISDDLLRYVFAVFHGRFCNHGLQLNSITQMALLRSSQVCASNLTRVNYVKYSMEMKSDHKIRLQNDPSYLDYHSKIVSLSNNICRTGSLMTTLFKRFSATYYYAWKVSKVQSSIFSFLDGEDLYKSPVQALKKLHSFQFAAGQLDQLNLMIYSLGKGIEQVVNFDTHSESVFVKSEVDINQFSPGSSIASPKYEMKQDTSNYIDSIWIRMMSLKEPVEKTKAFPPENQQNQFYPPPPPQSVPINSNLGPNVYFNFNFNNGSNYVPDPNVPSVNTYPTQPQNSQTPIMPQFQVQPIPMQSQQLAQPPLQNMSSNIQSHPRDSVGFNQNNINDGQLNNNNLAFANPNPALYQLDPNVVVESIPQAYFGSDIDLNNSYMEQLLR